MDMTSRNDKHPSVAASPTCYGAVQQIHTYLSDILFSYSQEHNSMCSMSFTSHSRIPYFERCMGHYRPARDFNTAARSEGRMHKIRSRVKLSTFPSQARSYCVLFHFHSLIMIMRHACRLTMTATMTTGSDFLRPGMLRGPGMPRTPIWTDLVVEY